MQATTKESRGSLSHGPQTASVFVPDLWLGRFIDGCLAGSLVLAPLFMGGRGAIGQFVFVLLPCLAAIAWCARQALRGESPWRWSGAEWLLAAGALLVVAQLLPLPQSLLVKLVPASQELLPLWLHNAPQSLQLGQWSTISLTPEFTRGGLTMFLSYGLFFLVLIQRIRAVEDVERLLRVVACAAVLMAIVGLSQFFSGSEKYLWLYEHKSRSAATVVRGTFQNENHFAHFLSLGLGPLVWCLYRSRGKRQRSHSARSTTPAKSAAQPFQVSSLQPVILASLVLVALAGLLTFSRGGVLTMAIALVTTVIVMRWKSLIDRRTTVVLTVVAAVNLLAMFLFGFESLANQLGSVFQASSFTELFDNRIDLWRAMCDGISDFYRTGSGIGSHREVYPIYMEEQIDAEFTHGECGYLQLLLEAGIGGLGLMLAGIVLSFRWCLGTLLRTDATSTSEVTRSEVTRSESTRSNESTRSESTRVESTRSERSAPTSHRQGVPIGITSCACAILPGLVASVVHSVADFVWYIPACMVLTIALLASACRLFQLSRGSPEFSYPTSRAVRGTDDARYQLLPRMAWLSLTAVLALATWAMAQNRLGPALAALDWDAYMKLAIVHRGSAPPAASQEQERLAAMEWHLQKVLRYEPQNGRAHLRLSAVFLKQFELTRRSAENSMDLAQFRDAAFDSHFPTKAAQDTWLNVALGDGRQLLDKALWHSHQAVALSPLQGRGYVQLARLTFLESPRQELTKAYVDQAVRVRPHDGQVLFIRGEEAAFAHNESESVKYLKRAFQQDPEIRQLIIDWLADQTLAATFVASFEPDTQSLGQLFQRYQAKGRLDEAKWVGQRFVSALEKDPPAKSNVDAALDWQQAQAVFTCLGDGDQALRCQLRAVELAPLNFKVRHSLATVFATQHRLGDAIKQLEWCLRRQPDNDELRNELSDLRIRQLQQSKVVPVSTPSAGNRR